MPYIKQEDRDQLDKWIDGLSYQVGIFDNKEGALNYSISKLLINIYILKTEI